MSGLQRDGSLEGRAIHPELLDADPHQRLPWPTAVLTITLLSLLSWGALGGVAAVLFR